MKEINAVAACNVFSTAVMCSPEVAPIVHEVWSLAFLNTDQLFFAQTKAQARTGICNYNIHCITPKHSHHTSQLLQMYIYSVLFACLVLIQELQQ